MQDAAREKVRLRAALLAARRSRRPADLAAARGALAGHVLARAAADGWRCVAGYVPLRTEPGSVGLLAALAGRGVRVLVPITRPDRDLDWRVWTGPEPSSAPVEALGPAALGGADAVLVPALAAAPDGTRLGRGGGSYDRALDRAAPHAPRIALLFDDELVDALPREAWDRPMSEAVTPSGWVRFGPDRESGVAAPR